MGLFLQLLAFGFQGTERIGVPTLGIVHSHVGTMMFPRWDQSSPTLGIFLSTSWLLDIFFEQMQKNPEDLTFIFEKSPCLWAFQKIWGRLRPNIRVNIDLTQT